MSVSTLNRDRVITKKISTSINEEAPKSTSKAIVEIRAYTLDVNDAKTFRSLLHHLQLQSDKPNMLIHP